MRNIGELRLDSDDQRYPAIRCFLICLVLLTLGVACRTSDTSRTTTSTSRVSPTGTSMPAPAPTAVLNPTATADLTVTQTASSNTRDDIQLLFGQTAIPEIAGLEITFLGVSEGSRCGEGVNCVIAGQANEDSLLENPFSKPKSESKLTHDLADLWDEYTAYTDRASSVPFQPDNPLMPVIGGKVVIDTSATDAAAASKLLASLESYGLQNGATSGRMVSGYLPMSAINSLNGLNYLNLARPAYASTSVGSVTSQADTAMLADVARTTFGVDGTGITVGTMSDSFDCLSGASGDVGTGDLPSGIVVLDDSECPGTDEGRAMMQLIHDVAPGSSQIFHTAFGGQANFATGINDLVTAGSDIIVDDVGYHAEPMFQDGIIAQAVDTAVAGGVAYFSSSGNLARKAYESQFVDSGEFPLGSSSGPAHDFDLSGGVDAFQSITIPGGGTTVQIVLQWDDPFFSVSGAPGADTDMDIFITDDPPTVVLASSEDPNIANGDPVEVVSITNNGATSTFNVMILRFAGPAPLAMKYVLFNRFVTINEHGTSSGTNYGHPNAAGAESVGAAEFSKTPFFGVSPPLLESFSSAGPTLIRFNTSGNAISPVTRNKPEIVAPDGTNTTFFGSDSTNDADSFPNFFGTSAAAPHAAAAAALMLDANGSLSPSDIYSALETTAIDMESEGFDFDSGFGLIQADDAVGAVASVAGICTPPDFGDWTVTQSCTLTGSPTASANVIVGAGITLTIDGNATLDIDFINFHLLIRDNASVIVKGGGKIN